MDNEIDKFLEHCRCLLILKRLATEFMLYGYPVSLKSVKKGVITMAEKKVQLYCLKCRKKQVPEKLEYVTMKNGREATKGICPKCGTKMFQIGHAEAK
jgi:RNase P subunit RPR2